MQDIDVPHQRVDDLQSIALCLASAQAPSSKLTRLVNRTMVEGGAPYRHCVGLPHYPPDSFDNDLTYPIKGNYERVNGTGSGGRSDQDLTPFTSIESSLLATASSQPL